MSGISSTCLIAGLPGLGKTELARHRLQRWHRAGAMCIVHDPDHQFLGLAEPYDSARAFAADVRSRTRSGTPVPSAIRLSCLDERDVTALALRLSASGRRPTYVLYDETVLMDSISAHHISPEMREALGRRRHRQLAIDLLCQDLGQVHGLLVHMATDLLQFRCSDIDRIKTISRRYGLDLSSLTRCLARLPDYHYAHIQRGRVLGTATNRTPDRLRPAGVQTSAQALLST